MYHPSFADTVHAYLCMQVSMRACSLQNVDDSILQLDTMSAEELLTIM
jgi:hypothetical protein